MSRLSGKDIAEIAALLDASQFSTLDLKIGDFKLKIRRDGAGGGWDAPDDEMGDAELAPVEATPAPSPAAASASAPASDEVDVPAPLLGNFYTAPRPGEPPFVEVGSKVDADTTIGIIEVMKLMNPIRAGVSGTVVAIVAENSKPVEEGQALVRVKADG